MKAKDALPHPVNPVNKFFFGWKWEADAMRVLLAVMAAGMFISCSSKPPPPAAKPEKAEIQFIFPGLPVRQALSVYEQYVGQNVIVPANLPLKGTVHVVTPQPLTRTDAAKLLEDVLRDQAHIRIVHRSDGNLAAEAVK